VWEGSRTNIFAVNGRRLITPRLDGPYVRGIMRDVVLARARQLDLAIENARFIALKALAEAEEVVLTNSFRGIIPAARVSSSSPDWPKRLDWPAPGPTTRSLVLLLDDWLRSETGGTPA